MDDGPLYSGLSRNLVKEVSRQSAGRPGIVNIIKLYVYFFYSKIIIDNLRNKTTFFKVTALYCIAHPCCAKFYA